MKINFFRHIIYGSKQMFSCSVGFKFNAMKVCESNRGSESHLLSIFN